MGSVDAPRSCGSNTGRRFGIGQLIVEERIVLYVAWTTLVVGWVTLHVPMYALNRYVSFVRFKRW
eukprot:scaffold618915_cov63-Attheya_sp.AAC.1